MSPEPMHPLPERAAQTTRENPWPLRLLSEKMKGYIEKMSPVWIEGEIVELKIRPGNKMSFMTLRDLESDSSLNLSMWAGVVEPLKDTLAPGSRVVTYLRPTFWERSGSLIMQAAQIHQQGLGEMLARIELLRKQLASEGLFASERKHRLPFLPRRVGLICGEGAKAESDVIVNARSRWPATEFVIEHAYVQGDNCAPSVVAALQKLQTHPQVDVIIITRGGGAVADLLPFSDERIIRAVAACPKPVVSAIGHESDCPLLDLVADYRASTPTDAARKVVPDLTEELATLSRAKDLLNSRIRNLIDLQLERLHAVRSRPTFTSPAALLGTHLTEIHQLREACSERTRRLLDLQLSYVQGITGRLEALSPQSVLERGYAVLRRPDRSVITDAADLKKGELVEGMLAQGSFVAQIVGAQPKNLSRGDK